MGVYNNRKSMVTPSESLDGGAYAGGATGAVGATDADTARATGVEFCPTGDSLSGAALFCCGGHFGNPGRDCVAVTELPLDFAEENELVDVELVFLFC